MDARRLGPCELRPDAIGYQVHDHTIGDGQREGQKEPSGRVFRSVLPLSAPDRAALRTLMTRHFGPYAFPHTRAKLLWDALEPGGFSRQLAPNGVGEVGAVDEEVIPVLLERLEKHGEARLCPGGRMMDADRAVLNALVLAKGRVWNVEKRAYETRPQ